MGANLDYARAVALAPNNPQVFAALANACYHQGDWAGAIGLADRAIALDPKCHSAWMCRGLAKHHTGDNAGALADLDQLIALIPEHSAGLYNRGMIRMEMGDADGALADYAHAIAAYPTNSFAYNGIARIRELRGDFAGAQEAYQNSISAEPWHATYNRFEVMLILRRRHLDESPAGLAQAVDGWPEGWTKTVGRFLLGWMTDAAFFAQAASGPAKEAREHLCEACYYAGMIHLLGDDPATARELFEKCLETGVTNFYEFKLAGNELKRLSSPTPTT